MTDVYFPYFGYYKLYLPEASMVDWSNGSPKISMSELLEPANVALKRDFADMTKLRILRHGDYRGLSRWAEI